MSWAKNFMSEKYCGSNDGHEGIIVEFSNGKRFSVQDDGYMEIFVPGVDNGSYREMSHWDDFVYVESEPEKTLIGEIKEVLERYAEL